MPILRSRSMHAVSLAAALLMLTPFARADGEVDKLMTAADKARLAEFDKIRMEAIDEARKGGSAEDVASLDAILAGNALDFAEGFDPTGDWRCRTIKLGGTLPLTLYGRFKCRISDDGSAWKLEKLSGSQRTSGAFYTESETRLTYLGALHYGDEKPKRYGAEPERDQVAYAVRPDDKRIRLEFPSPQYESKLDILELVR